MTVFAAEQQFRGVETALPSYQARLACRAGDAENTAGVAPGFVQGNLAILPEKLASAFHRFCQLNPKPCPIIGMSDVGDPKIPLLGIDLDIRTDLPRYRVWRDGELIEEPTDIMAHWRDDLVAFVIGCSFSFEEALMADDLPIRHIEQKVRVPMYRTNIACAPAGPFAGPMVVSMRPFKPKDAIRAVQITSRFPAVHGAPVHLGLPQSIGIADLAKPDYGDAVTINADELPVFWACGVTPQAVIAAARVPFAITHAPGLMLVTDLKNKHLAVL
ncbi:MAG: putative hydro-lyase [Rhodopseudomonas sp.]|uniref:putative hydro-lyase n=1 Tax=Rhodopseudomonas sp. TaxID=1078 RepID=UPI0018394996|nr:putative hydro-lyase [Rhodopseudomonas sp.]NVN84483.1 putative hydro-lyase [Rhodopseudomonas sp.]